MKEARNYKFLNRQPLILGFEFADCIYAVSTSIVFFSIFKNHFLSLIIGFALVITKSLYRKYYPKNSVYFLRYKRAFIKTSHSFSFWRKQ